MIIGFTKYFFFLALLCQILLISITISHGEPTTATTTISTVLKVSPPLNYTPSFPRTIQYNDRILVSITVAYQNRLEYLNRQLAHYAQACEQAYEIHVLLITRVKGWEKLPLLTTPGLFRCNRLHMDLFIEIFDNPPIKEHLAFYHRPIFKQLSSNYDYFICQEDDLLITAPNIKYFIKYEAKLRGSGMLPTFAMYEIPAKFPLSDEIKTQYPLQALTWPRVWETSTFKLKINGHFVKYNDEYYLLPYKTYCASYMIPRWVLDKYSVTDAWLGDEHKPWYEYNVHFAHMWLNRYFFMALPVSSWFEHAFIHHSPNRYVNDIFTKANPGLGKFNLTEPRHDFSVDVNEMTDFVMEAFGIRINKGNRLRHRIIEKHNKFIKSVKDNAEFFKYEVNSWDINIVYTTYAGEEINDLEHLPLRGCADAGKAARIELGFFGKFPECFYQRKATIKVKFQCWIKDKALFTQEAAKCKKEEKEKCNIGFGPDVKPYDEYK